MTLHSILAILGTACGIYYTYLGVVVGGHALDAQKRKSPLARILLTGVAWSVGPGDEYSEAGKQICRKGNWVLVASIITWFAFGVLRRQSQLCGSMRPQAAPLRHLST